MDKKSIWKSIVPLVAIGLAVAYSLGLILDSPDWINGRNWEWVRRLPGGGGRILWLIGISLGALFLWFWTQGWKGERTRKTFILVGWAVLITPILQLAIAGQHRSQPWSVIFLSTSRSGFYQDGIEIDAPLVFVQEHFENMRSYRDVHVRTQPPGWQVAFWAASRLAERVPTISEPFGRHLIRADCLSPDVRNISPAQASAAILSLSILLWSGLGTVPYWRLARYFLKGRPFRLAMIIYPFWPSLLVFTGRFDVLYAVLALLALWLAQHTLVYGRWLSALIFAVVMAGATWFGSGTLAIVALVDIVLLSQLLLNTVNRRHGVQQVVLLNGLFILALVALWGGLWLTLRVDGVGIFVLGQELHRKFRIVYPIWPLFNLFDLAVFIGIITFVGSLMGLVGVVGRKLIANKRPLRPIDGLIVGWIIAVVMLNLSGQVRAETGRLWLFLMGPGLLVGVAGWTDWLKETDHRQVWETLLLAGVLGQAMVTGLFLGGRAPESSVPNPVWSVEDELTAVAYTLGDNITLQGYALQELDDEVELTLYWQPSDFIQEDFVVFTHLLGPNGEILAQDDGPPQAGGLPTWCWVPGEVIQDKRVLPLVSESQIGVGFYEWQTGVRLVVDPPMANDTILMPSSEIQN